MTEPLVCAIMLTSDRPAMAARAIQSFRSQTYGNVLLFVLDTSEKCTPGTPYGEDRATTVWMPPPRTPLSIGILRNGTIRAALGWQQFDIVAHFDDDDYSHPNRIAEQVALLQSSGADCVGYREMLFWRQADKQAWIFRHAANPNYCLGTSLCYWRSAWERNPFPDKPSQDGPQRSGRGEDNDFCKGLKCVGVSSLDPMPQSPTLPRMIASIHAGNAKWYEGIEKNASWRRVPEWDEYCRERMRL